MIEFFIFMCVLLYLITMTIYFFINRKNIKEKVYFKLVLQNLMLFILASLYLTNGHE